MALSGAIGDFGGAVSDLFAASADRTKAQGLQLESQQYTLAENLSEQNAAYTAQSTAIQEAQKDREILQTIGKQQADVASSGFSSSGSALYLMMDSANQGALAKATLAQQGQITEAGYEEQAQSYGIMSQAANLAANAANKAAQGADISAVIKGVAGVAALVS